MDTVCQQMLLLGRVMKFLPQYGLMSFCDIVR